MKMFSYVLICKDLQFTLGKEASYRSVCKISQHSHRKEKNQTLYLICFHMLSETMEEGWLGELDRWKIRVKKMFQPIPLYSL